MVMSPLVGRWRGERALHSEKHPHPQKTRVGHPEEKKAQAGRQGRATGTGHDSQASAIPRRTLRLRVIFFTGMPRRAKESVCGIMTECTKARGPHRCTAQRYCACAKTTNSRSSPMAK